MILLSEVQIAIVTSPIGQPMQILASAGTGKTRVLTERVRHILENTRKDGVIALTFTNKAAEEMQARLDSLADVEERCWIATIHAVAQRILDQYGHTIGLPSELHIYERDQDRKAVFLQALRESDIDIDSFLNIGDDRTRDREKTIQKYLDQVSVIKRELLTEEEVKEKYENDESFWSIYQEYQTALIQSGGLDFDDILVYAHRILLEQTWCSQVYRAKYKHICVDEAQDLNKAQYEFIKALCGDQIKSVTMVGDPNQMIYGFNGSSHDYLCQRFVEDFSPTKFELKENYRSSKAIIHLANKLKPGSQVESDFVLKGRSHIEEHTDEESEALWVCDKIRELINEKSDPEIEGEISLMNMVVIARNRFAFQTLEKILSEKRIPFSLKKGERQIEPSSLFGKVLDLAIRVQLNPKDWVDGKKLCAALKIKNPRSWGGDNVLQTFADAARGSDIHVPDIQARLLEAIQVLDLDRPNILKLCDDFTKLIGALSTNQTFTDDIELERSFQELQGFRKSWTIFKKKGLGESLSSFRNAMALGQVCDDYNSSGITLSTVHTMKGLERDIVFIIGMCEGIFPDYRAHSKKQIEEERNNAFVAVTRAKRWIYITYPQQRIMPWGGTKQQQPSRFLRDMQA